MTRRAPKSTVVATLVLAVAAVGLTPLIGAVDVSAADVWAGIDPAHRIFVDIRLPRVLLGAIAGAVLAAAGLVFQTILRNDLATPFTLGAASGASVGAVIAFHLGLELADLWLSPVPLFAFAGATAVLLLILAVVRARGRAMDTATLLLGGITISLLCSATILLIEYLSDFTATQRMIFWMMGGLDTVGYGSVGQAFVFAVAGLVVVVWHIPTLNQLLVGDLVAASRGVAVRRARLTLLLAASLMTAGVIAFTGPIGFVGLLVPHTVKRLTGPNHAWSLPATVLGGAALLPLCDLVARTVIAPAEIPVGVLTAFIGAPFFLLVLLRR